MGNSVWERQDREETERYAYTSMLQCNIKTTTSPVKVPYVGGKMAITLCPSPETERRELSITYCKHCLGIMNECKNGKVYFRKGSENNMEQSNRHT